MACSGVRDEMFGWIALVGVLAFVIVVVSLQVAQPGYDGTTQLMSELALGPHGGYMYVAFGGLAVGTLAVGLGAGTGRHALVSRGLLVAASLFFAIAGAFTLATAAEIHIMSVAVGFVVVVVAMYLAPSSGEGTVFPKRGASWSLAAGTALSIAAGQGLLPMGIGQRLGASCIIVWLTLSAIHQIQVRRNV